MNQNYKITLDKGKTNNMVLFNINAVFVVFMYLYLLI